MEPKVIEIVPGYGITCTQRQIDEVEAQEQQFANENGEAAA